MVSRGFTLVAVVAIALLAVFHQGVALKCRQCNSLTNKNCSDNPASIEPTECKSSPTPVPTTTISPTSETTTSAAATTTPPPATTITQPPVTATTQAPVTATTQAPVTATTQGPVTATTQAPVTATTQAPVTATTQAPVTATTQAPVTATTQAPVTATTPAPATATTQASTVPPVNGGGEGQNGNSRRRRNVMAEDSETVCYKLVYKSGIDDVVERGCYAKENACEKLKFVDGRSDADCYLCEKDGCNASSRLSLGILSIFAPVVLLAVFRW